MKTDESLIQYARLLAVQAAVMGLLRSLPHNPRIPALIEDEAERALALLLAHPMPEAAIEAFRSQLHATQSAANRFHGSN